MSSNLLTPEQHHTEINATLSQESAWPSKNSRFKSPTPLQRSSYIPPWSEPYIVGVAGNSGSGKTSVSQKIIKELNQPWTVLLSFDNFYRPLNAQQSKLAFENKFDFDTPESLEMDLLVDTVKKLKKGERTDIPIYSFAKHNRTDKSTTIYGANVIIIEGLYALYDPRLLELMDLKIFMDTTLDICLSRRLTRDILYRGRDLEGALKQWELFVKPNAVAHINPTMKNADLVIPRGLDNQIAINLMIKHIQKQLLKKSYSHLENLKSIGLKQPFDLIKFPNVKLLPNTNHTRGIHSILFNRNSERSDFIFYFDRIAILIIEHALDFLTDFAKKNVITPGKYAYDGFTSTSDTVMVNIIRSGDCFMNAIKKTFPEISIGKLLIQSDSLTGEPQLHTESLPKSLLNRKVFLCDAQTISGAASIMAIKVLIDHGVQEEDIILCSYLSTEIGLKRILNVFPSVNIVLGKLSCGDIFDNRSLWYNEERFLDNDWHFRNRFIDSLYFGTN